MLLPKNAIVSLQDNQKVIEYDNYKIVELYVKTQNLETSKTTISYVLLNPKCEEYSYKFFKQP
ncbi:MAG: hypothetical protein LBC61_02485 [Candidatus Peribacteria bacterium]|nr:hypothetical protein [Candidatus Peribacteria bacterium]